jgi:hypothetical protein
MHAESVQDAMCKLTRETIMSWQTIIKAVQSRWVIAGGLENHPWSKRDLLNLPPDRSMLGRAFWTVLSPTFRFCLSVSYLPGEHRFLFVCPCDISRFHTLTFSSLTVHAYHQCVHATHAHGGGDRKLQGDVRRYLHHLCMPCVQVRCPATPRVETLPESITFVTQNDHTTKISKPLSAGITSLSSTWTRSCSLNIRRCRPSTTPSCSCGRVSRNLKIDTSSISGRTGHEQICVVASHRCMNRSPCV